MIKIYKTLISLVILIFLTTYTPKQININKKEDFFFKIKKIEIINNNKINKSNIIKKLDYVYGKNILFIKKSDLEQALNTIKFLEKIEIKKKYPNTIIIKVYETSPVAILYKNNVKFIIDNLSNLIFYDKSTYKNNLPNVFGENSDLKFIKFYNLLKNEKFPIKRINNYYYFQINRWDVQLFNEQIIKFSSSKTEESIKQSIELLQRDDFKNYDVIDLRIYGKIVVE
jgi:cell division septal protein FtsQ